MQVIVTTALIAATVSGLAAVQGPGAIILGGGLALSSTAVAMQVRAPCCMLPFVLVIQLRTLHRPVPPPPPTHISIQCLSNLTQLY